MDDRSRKLELLLKQLLLAAFIVRHTSGSGMDDTDTGDFNPPFNRSDIIGKYRVDNTQQCQRLCWYRQPCTSYSYCGACHGSLNCLLHSHQVQGGNVTTTPHPGWTEHSATDLNRNGCFSRQCGQREVCVPTPHGGYRCLDNPALCGDAPDVPNGILENMKAVFQDDINKVTCPQHFVISPRNASMEIQCQANSRWTTPQGHCLRTEYHEPSERLGAFFPWPIEAGWGMCTKGILHDLVRIRFSPEECSYHTCDFPLQLVLGLVPDNSGYSKVTWTRSVNLLRDYRILSPSQIPLQSGQAFTWSMSLSEDAISVRLHGVANVSLSTHDITDGGATLSMNDVTHAQFSGDSSLTYVNLVAECTDD